MSFESLLVLTIAACVLCAVGWALAARGRNALDDRRRDLEGENRRLNTALSRQGLDVRALTAQYVEVQAKWEGAEGSLRRLVAELARKGVVVKDLPGKGWMVLDNPPFPIHIEPMKPGPRTDLLRIGEKCELRVACDAGGVTVPAGTTGRVMMRRPDLDSGKTVVDDDGRKLAAWLYTVKLYGDRGLRGLQVDLEQAQVARVAEFEDQAPA